MWRSEGRGGRIEMLIAEVEEDADGEERDAEE